jgi:hypothetical protein
MRSAVPADDERFGLVANLSEKLLMVQSKMTRACRFPDDSDRPQLSGHRDRRGPTGLCHHLMAAHEYRPPEVVPGLAPALAGLVTGVQPKDAVESSP